MTEQKRNAAADLAMCEAMEGGLLVDKIFAIKAHEVLSHWIKRAVAAEEEAEQLKKELAYFRDAIYIGWYLGYMKDDDGYIFQLLDRLNKACA